MGDGPRLTYERLCAEIGAQADLLQATVDGADLTVPVPSCPGWNVAQLLRHLGGGLRWAEEIVRTRPTGPPDDTHFREVSDRPDPGLGGWVAEAGRTLADALQEAGPDADVWSFVPGGTRFWARRFAHETVLHRADATLALGKDFTVGPEVALDALDEWMTLGTLPHVLAVHPEQRELLGAGRTIHLHTTDVEADQAAEWLVDLTGDTIAWRPAHEKAAVAVRGPLVDLLLLVYGRRPPTEATEIFGDRDLLDFWLARTSFE
jgi:uncharacterized protein (TIGR03083 family)